MLLTLCLMSDDVMTVAVADGDGDGVRASFPSHVTTASPRPGSRCCQI